MRAETFQNLMECIVNEIGKIKSNHSDAVIIVGGDMNRRNFDTITNAYNDMTTIKTDPTRGTAHLDLLASNIEEHTCGNEIYAPLETEEGIKSDHSIIMTSYMLPKKCLQKWKKYQAREKTDAGKAPKALYSATSFLR